MTNNKWFVFTFFAAAFISLFSIGFVVASDVMTAEVDLLADEGSNDIISIEVPDFLDFGELHRGETSEEFKIYVNNTGNVDIIVTPDLVDSNEEIFSYLYFRKFKTSGGEDVEFSRIGDFSFNITKPSSGEEFNDQYFYMILDLTDYPDEINEDILNHQANVKFYVVAS